ncbi:MAG: hypothetical protein U0414_34470 [Polyangiaceae bacterium]
MTADDASFATPKPAELETPTTGDILRTASQRPPPVVLESAPLVGPPAVPEAIPTLLAFAQQIAPQSPRHRSVKMLYRVLEDIDPRADRDGREKQMVNLAHWVASTGNSPGAETGYALLHPQAKRLALLASAMELFPPFRARVSRLLQSILQEQSALGLLSRVGIPGDRGLFAETVDRLSRRLMPEPIDEGELTQLLARMFSNRHDDQWIESLHPALVAWFIRLARRPSDGMLDDPARGGSNPGSQRWEDAALGAPPSMPPERLSPAEARVLRLHVRAREPPRRDPPARVARVVPPGSRRTSASAAPSARCASRRSSGSRARSTRSSRPRGRISRGPRSSRRLAGPS